METMTHLNERAEECRRVTVLWPALRRQEDRRLGVEPSPSRHVPRPSSADTQHDAEPGAIREIMRQFGDPRVGCVAGEGNG